MKPPHRKYACNILVVDDDSGLANTLREFLEREGYFAAVALSAAEALALQEGGTPFAIALVDLMMPEMDGLTLMAELHKRDPELNVVIMTGYGTIETAVEAIKCGAEDYLTKPFDYQTIRKKIGRLAEVFELREQVEQLEANLEHYPSFESFVFVSPVMQKVVDRAQTLAASDATVLVLGETGTGKEMLARAIHACSTRARAPFIPINCGAIPHELVESELFGVRRGAFTGANTDAPGLFATAAGGTVFLDEVGEMPKDVQVKLLRVLQEGELRPVGGTQTTRVDVRVISATNRSLSELRSGLLREDLYFRIATVTLELAPLRTRPEDVLVLAQHFATRLSRRYKRQITVSRSGLELLLAYPFPGNVRELEHILEGAAAVSHDDPQVIADKDLKPLLRGELHGAAAAGVSPQALSMEELERVAIQRALRICQGNRSRAASLLGISRDTLYRRLRQFGNSE